MQVDRVRTANRRHPRLTLALKTAIAASAAWLLVQPFGGFVRDYPYYAPLGAVVAMSTSVVGSVRSATQTVAAILTGAVLAFAVRGLPVAEPVAIGLGIGAAVLVQAARPFGTSGSWVPTATLFLLILGGSNPWGFTAAYGGLTALGAVVGLVVNLAWPQLPLTPAVLAQERLREQLADQLGLLADGLESADPLSPEDWAELRLELEPQARHAQDLVGLASESRRANWRANRWADDLDRQEEQARALQRLTGCVDEVITLVGDVRTSVHADGERAADLRQRIVAAFRAVASMLRTVDDTDGDDAPTGASARAEKAVAELAEAVGRAPVSDGDRYLAAGAIAVSLHQAVEAWR